MGTSVPNSLRATLPALPALAAAGSVHRDRVLPVLDLLAAVLPEGGLVRGRTVACVGSAAPTVAMMLAARATATGSWLAVVGLPWLGVEAARELGVSLERVVAVDVARPQRWAECVAAAVDGFEVVLAAPPRADRDLRRVGARLRSSGGVLVTLPGCSDAGGDAGGNAGGTDLVLSAVTESWEGIGRGHGRLAGRRLRLTVTGRRVPRPRTAVLPVLPTCSAMSWSSP